MLEVLTVGRFQNRIFIASVIISTGQEKENKTLFILMKKLEELLLTPDDLKSEDGQGYHKDKTQKLFKTMRAWVIECEFLQVLVRRDQ